MSDIKQIPQLIIFDFDGTLVDTTATILATYRMTIESVGADARSDAQVRDTIGLPLKEGFRVLFPDFTESKLDLCVDTYRVIFEENKLSYPPRLFPGVSETLEYLKSLGVRMTVASSRGRESLIDLCTATNIAQYMELILGADDVSRAKPHPEPVLLTMERLGVDASATYVVGDMPVDIAMGAGAGCRTIAVSYGNASRVQLEAAGADVVIDEFADLLSSL